MELKKIDVRYARKDSAPHADMDGIQHIKALPWLSLVQSLEGSYTISLEGGAPCETGVGGFFIAPSQVTQSILHHANRETHRMQNRWVFLDVLVNDTYRLDHLYDFPVLVPREERAALHALFDELFATHELCEEMSVYYRIIGLLLRIGRPKEQVENAALLRVTDYMRRHYAEEIGVAQLAQAAHLSPSGLFASFRRQFGVSPIAYLNQYRMTLASAMLKETDLPIRAVAEAVGFPDPLYFSRQFRRVFAMSPREYRKLP